MLVPGRKRTNWMRIRNIKSDIKLYPMMDYEVNQIKDTIEFDTIKYFVDNIAYESHEFQEFLAVYMTKPNEWREDGEVLYTDYILKVELFVKDSDVYTKFCVPGPEFDIKLRDSADLRYKEVTYKGEKILEIKKG